MALAALGQVQNWGQRVPRLVVIRALSIVIAVIGQR